MSDQETSSENSKYKRIFKIVEFDRTELIELLKSGVQGTFDTPGRYNDIDEHIIKHLKDNIKNINELTSGWRRTSYGNEIYGEALYGKQNNLICYYKVLNLIACFVPGEFCTKSFERNELDKAIKYMEDFAMDIEIGL